jgi:putative transposase
MTNYRRVKIEGRMYFFTVNCVQRAGNYLLIDNIKTLRKVFHKVRDAHSFEIVAMVVLPEHFHCIWTLPEGDSDYSSRWALIKSGFSRSIPNGEPCSNSRLLRGERGLWQRRFWEHLIRDDEDLKRHIDCIHWNPVKHGLVARVQDWPYSSFHRYTRRGFYPVDWACESGGDVGGE